MICSRARKWIALHAGGDLHSRRARRLETHLRKCAGCRTELEEHRAALESVRTVAGRETLDWSEAEWRTLIGRATSENPVPRRFRLLIRPPQIAWAYGLAGLLVLGVAAVILRGLLSPPAASLPSETAALIPAPPPRFFPADTAASPAPTGDVPFKTRKELEPTDRATLAARAPAQNPRQDMLALTLVSQETGLKVHWTFNRNFEWEEKRR